MCGRKGEGHVFDCSQSYAFSKMADASPVEHLPVQGKRFVVDPSFHTEIRNKVVKGMGDSSGVILMQGGLGGVRNDSGSTVFPFINHQPHPTKDHEPIFRQESYFHYLFGVKEPDCYGAIELTSGRCVMD
jgi:hypothetical protein